MRPARRTLLRPETLLFIRIWFHKIRLRVGSRWRHAGASRRPGSPRRAGWLRRSFQTPGVRVVRAGEQVAVEAAHLGHLAGDAGDGRQGLAGGAQALRTTGAAGRTGGGEQAALFEFVQAHLGAGERRLAGGGKSVAGGAERAGLGDLAQPGLGRPEVVAVGQEFGVKVLPPR